MGDITPTRVGLGLMTAGTSELYYSGREAMGAFDSETLGTSIDMPGPAPRSPEEQQLLTAELQLLEEERKFNKLLEPYILRAAGLRRTSEGGLESIPVEELTEIQRNTQKIQELWQSRQLKALTGDLPPDPVLEQDLAAEKERLVNRLQTTKGERWAETTGGIAELQEFEKKAGLLRSASRKGELTTAESALIGRLQAQPAAQTQGLINLQSLAPGRFRDLSQRFGTAAQPYTGMRSQQMGLAGQGALMEAQNRMQLFQTVMGGVSQGMGGLTALAMA